MTTKQELIERIEVAELSRIGSLSFIELKKMTFDWFMGMKEKTQQNRAEMTIEYMNDFMRWREDDSVEELQEKLHNYKHD